MNLAENAKVENGGSPAIGSRRLQFFWLLDINSLLKPRSTNQRVPSPVVHLQLGEEDGAVLCAPVIHDRDFLVFLFILGVLGCARRGS